MTVRKPSSTVSVELTVRPRSDTAAEPWPKPPVNAVGIEPLLSAEIERTASATLVMPRRASDSELSTVTGDAVSLVVRRNSEPVTTISSVSAPSLVFVTGTAGASAPASGALLVA
ncbi:MAG: hypothetical protein AVDCRST_MAG23-1284 [uncultured Sphingosinicella sp.]|uniref:Uncharacterized protein n=1 Tax=uncultured Sphingosinicella sp. TaxID=478748 RepID=A0A6J4TWC1_9SPHN|nr:MAG: hypothetical protein AVDCRST_MAG23-1284 [uncultured Sphingosinicella sp.]